MSEFILSPLAEDDLGEIVDYIARDDPVASRRVLADIRTAIDTLVAQPRAGHLREDLVPGQSFRFWRVHSYLIVYLPDTRPIAIARVLSGHRDIEAILADTVDR